MTNLILLSALIILCYAVLWFIISVIVKRNDIVDIAWGLGYVLLICFYLVRTDLTGRTILVSILVILWGIRLAVFVYMRNSKKKEDFRYLNWRNTWKNFYLRSFLQIYLLQGTLLLIIISPVSIMFAQNQTPLNFLDVIGLMIWIIGFMFEAIGDRQLILFKKNPDNKGKIIKNGLWRYSRHPNYFKEVMLWWGIFIITLSSPNWYFGLLGPLAISFLILKVSGIPMLEAKYDDNPDYQEYKKQTSKFFPLPEKKNS